MGAPCALGALKYWGWAKYRYCQVVKKTFEDAKKAALDALDTYPTDTIKWFCN